MPTVKLVVIGSSGVGKTSLRGKYISGRFSNGYRATIGADFITKTLPHPTDPEQMVTLQIWDTAGQERFSSLSTAFFRGADAALLMFDVNAPETMEALKKWWADFRDKAPLADEDMQEYCCVVVGNKIDMVGSGRELQETVSESEALEFLDELVPSSSELSLSTSSPSTWTGNGNGHQDADGDGDELASSQHTIKPPSPSSSPGHSRSSSIAIIPPPDSSHIRQPSHSPKHQLSKSRSRSSSRFYSGTMTTTHTAVTIYHTPSSSLFDVYQSARSSPEPWSSSESELHVEPAANATARQRRLTMLSTGSTSSGSAPTITPSLFARERQGNGAESVTPVSSPLIPAASGIPLPPERGPKLFFTSAKTGEGVADVFEYIAQRVVRKWEYDEWAEARRMHFREASGAAETVRLQGSGARGQGTWAECCST
ncbi:unnamed protein product [Cyclocybe aegerita]|uniref:Ras-domain-containing protein n=1 Tax=Cyclocybe aegerita TaxID=1973307 RepID=A0A8S0VRI7_CYCAE|nr:unnamed protein product [Cyclocybe aegerita]